MNTMNTMKVGVLCPTEDLRDLGDLALAIAAAVPDGTRVVMRIEKPRPPIEDGICQGCGFPARRLRPCPRGAACRWVLCDCSPCTCGQEPDDMLEREEEEP